MRLDVSKALVSEGAAVPFACTISLPDTTVLGEAVVFPEPAALFGSYASVGDAVHIQGVMRFSAHARCMRCLREALLPLETALDALYTLTPDRDNPDLYRYDGAWIDLSDLVADAAHLALPMQLHCGEDCKGLCPVCGENRNLNQCSCRMEAETKHPFAALQQLLNKDESEV